MSDLAIAADVSEAGLAFLRWIECAADRTDEERREALSEGTSRTWGELRISARLVDGEKNDDTAGNKPAGRRYDLRHIADAEAGIDDLDTHDDPLDAREIATFDDRGNYRPLKTAPTLRTGWVFPDLGPEELLDAVDFLYPATVENWYREREGTLDVSHWRETADRQTGIYDVVDELPEEALPWAVEACCTDEMCLKRREWDYERGEELDVPRGDGAFPCREPCSLFIAAAREFAVGEKEEPETVEMELTPTEREQIEAVVDAVAEGEEGRIGEVRNPTNRYRVRYLRAKRFGDERDGPDK